MARLTVLLVAMAALLAACAAGPDSGSKFQCDRNGDFEQRMAC
jgi:type IV pilus biogenesis protein CpaD/CtpE